MDENREPVVNNQQKAKQVIALLIAVIMMFALTACGSRNELASIKNTVAVGDIIEFGAYEQDKDTSDGKENVEWQVLAKEDNKILVISKYVLDAKPYNTNLVNVTWETCALQTWLNGTFFDEAFSEAEQSMIQTNATEDRIFLLSIDEANKYFATDEARMCAPTASARAKGAYTDDNYKVDGAGACCWWLRSPGGVQFFAANVYYDGGVNSFGSSFTYGLVGVRPAMWIDLDA